MTNRQLVLERLLGLDREALSYMFPGLQPEVLSIPTHEFMDECGTLPKASIATGSILPEEAYVTEEAFVTHEDDATDEDDARRHKILAAVEKIQKEFGISIEELELVLSYSVKLSRLRVRGDSRIFLVDYDNMEVKMDPLTKAVFLLFLKHPEGIEYKDISDHRSEIEAIYGRISRSGDPAAVTRSLDLLCNPVESNSLNEKVSRVKRAFINAKDERIASHYYIDGPAGGIRKIALDRSKVIWG